MPQTDPVEGEDTACCAGRLKSRRLGTANVSSKSFSACLSLVGNAKLEILLVTTRRTKPWIIPKGWPIKGLKSAKTSGA
jgi:hypothetical protein